MLRFRRPTTAIFAAARLSLCAVLGLCLLAAMVHAAARFASADVVHYRFHPPKWRQWPSSGPQGAGGSEENRRNPLPSYVPPNANREERTLPLPRDTFRDKSNGPLRKSDRSDDSSEGLIPDVLPEPTLPDSSPATDPNTRTSDLLENGEPKKDESPASPFRDDDRKVDDKPDDNLFPDEPADKQLPRVDLPGDDATSGRLPRSIMGQLTQRATIPGAAMAATETVQRAALSFDDPAPRPQGIAADRPLPSLQPAVGPRPGVGRAAIRMPRERAPSQFIHSIYSQQRVSTLPRIVEPNAARGQVPRRLDSDKPYNPLRLRQTSQPQPSSSATSHVQRSSHQQTTPRRRNPLR